MKKLILRLLGKSPTSEASGRKKGDIVTAPLSPEKAQLLTDTEQPTNPLGQKAEQEKLDPPQFMVGIAQSVGRQREVNQDSVFAFSSTLASNTTRIPFGLYLVADGMGGHQHGEVASEIAVRVMGESILRNLYLPLVNPKNVAPTQSLQEIMQKGVMEAHQAILSKTPDGGTTLTACMLLGRQLTIAHVGDSRAYHIDMDGTLTQLTRDHSLVRRLEEMGQITAEEAQVHPQRNVLYRALGQGEPFEPEIESHRLPSSGFLLICSDGLWGVVPENKLTEVIASNQSLQTMCQRLVRLANEAGGPDNISVILVRVAE